MKLNNDKFPKVLDAVYLSDLNTPLGPMIAGVTDKGLCLLEFTTRVKLEKELKDLEAMLGVNVCSGKNKYSDQIEKELKEYFEGTRRVFTLPLHTPGNEFSKSVWDMLLQIPYGDTWTYKKQSEQMKMPLAIRAIAAMNGKNRLAIVIPCHRVIGSDGSLTGYAGGIDKKRWLLNFEREHMPVKEGFLF